VGNVGFYLPLNLEINKGTTVVWINDDNIEHTIQSQDEKGNPISLFQSELLKTEKDLHINSMMLAYTTTFAPFILGE